MNKSKLLSQYVLNGKKPSVAKMELISWAENNRVLFSLAIKDPDIKEVEFVGREWIEKLEKTLKEIKKTLKIRYLVTRTYKYIEYVTFDVDVFVKGKDFAGVVKKFKERGFKIESHDSSLGGRLPGMQVNIKKEGLLTIDLHQNFTWSKRKFLDPFLVIKNPIKRIIAGQTVLTPSPEVELLLCVADIAHERFNITLLDLIWLEGLSKEIRNWQLVFDQTKKYKWFNVFKQTSSIINQLTLDIYEKTIIPEILPNKGNYELPFFLSLPMCWRIYLNTFLSAGRFPVVSFLYMHYNQLKFLIWNKMPYYSPWHTG